MPEYLARFYPDNNYNHAWDFQFEAEGTIYNRYSIEHVGGGDLPDKIVARIEPELITALINFSNRFKAVLNKPCRVEIYKQK